MELKEYKELFKNIKNYSDLKAAVDFGLLEECYIPNALIESGDLKLSNYSELDNYLKLNNIPEQNVLYIKDGSIDSIVLIKHNNGALELLEEIWDSTDTDENGNEMCIAPYLNDLNIITEKLSKETYQTLTKKELMNKIKNNLGYFSEWLDNGWEDLHDFYKRLSNTLDKWNITLKESDY